jgi:hypothetical protein
VPRSYPEKLIGCAPETLQSATIAILIFFAPLLNAFGRIGVSPFTWVGFKLFLVLALLGVVYSGVLLLLKVKMPLSLQRALFILNLAFLFTLFLETSGALLFYWRQLQAGTSLSGSTLLLATIGSAVGFALLLSWAFSFMNSRVIVMCNLFLIAFSVSTVWQNWGNWHPTVPAPQHIAVANKDPILHIILDEMIGLSGIPLDIEGGQELKNHVESVFLHHGFTIYPRAFSRHFMTTKSIPNLLNFDFQDQEFGAVSMYQDARNSVINRKNAYFENLRAQGYALNVYQSAFMDWCQAVPIDSCNTFPSKNPLSRFLGSNQLVNPDSVLLQLLRLSGDSRLLAYYIRFFEDTTADNVVEVNPMRFDMHGMAGWFDLIFSNVSSNTGATATYVHVLAPHGPYVMDSACKVARNWEELPQFMREEKGLSLEDFKIERQKQYAKYFAQAHCTIDLIDNLLTRLKGVPAMKNAKIIIHGDHGSRLSAGRFAESLEDRDYEDNYSTLFAIKMRTTMPGLNDRRVSIQRLFAEFFDPKLDLKTPYLPTVLVEKRENSSTIAKSF